MACASADETVRSVRPCRRFNEQKGYGFIQPDEGGKDVFCTSAPLTRAPQRGRSQGQGGLVSGRGCCARRGAAPGRAWCETGRANRGAWCEARQANPAEGGAGDAPPGVLNETTPSLIIFKLAAVLREWLRLPPGTPHNEQRPEELLLGPFRACFALSGTVQRLSPGLLFPRAHPDEPVIWRMSVKIVLPRRLLCQRPSLLD